MVAPTRILRTSWPSTLRLPKSSFPPRPLPESSAEYLRRCTDDLYSWQQDSRQSSETFTLHDGPPYANGPLHIGHALNKITKDIICRYQVSQGKKVSFIPGWDCHGLPIEIKALQAQKKDLASTHPVSVREAARQLAADTIESQKAGFKEWAVMGDWAHAYKTMDKEFEIRQLEVFKKMFEKGLIYRQYKPVYWSPSSRTALAEAELEYDENYKSLAAYVRYPIQMAEELRSGPLNAIQEPLSVIIWTTTPWTLPANRAIAVHNDMGYCVIRYDMDGSEYAIIADSRLEEFQKTLNRPVEVVLSGIRGSSLAEKLWYQNPFQKGRGLQKVIHADFVTDSSGTGLVHMAPGHGMDDYHVCSALGIEAFAPVDDAGTFTKDAFPDHPELLEGLPVTDIKKSGSTAVLNYLGSLDFVLAKHNYRHKYPIDWRTKEPVITRATAQWFANAESIKKDAMNAIEEVEFLPETGRSRLESFIQGRSQWCISRQRAWGVPIPALYKAQEDGQLEAVMDSQTIEHIVNVIKERGIDAWWTDAPDDPVWTPKHLDGSHLRGKDTMDVWFDSGTSWTLLPAKPDEPVADVYLEGTDQHRGWFQSSLLTHVSTMSSDTHKIKAPYKTLITHGFTLDSKGRKMSKSLGNVIAPSQIMSGELLPPIKRKKQKGVEQEQPKKAGPTYDAMGSDALRLWAASSNYTQDVTVGQPMLMTINQALHKYRVTFKWLLGVLSLPTCPPVFTSFNGLRTTLAGTSDGNAKASNISNLADRLAFHRLAQVSHEVHHHYSKYEFHKGVGVINKYIANDLSAFYFETLKDRIYTGHQRDCEELQRILGLIFYELLHMIGPICPLLVEEVWDHTPAALQKDSTHPARAIWTPLPRPSPLEAKHLTATQALVNKLNTSIKAAQERLRAEKKLGSSLESSVVLFVHHNAADNTNNPSPLISSSSSSTDWFQSHFGPDDDLAGLFVVSAFAKETYHPPASKHDHAAWKAATQPPSQWWDEEPLDPKDVGEGHSVLVFQASGTKCPRCWKFTKPAADELCERCDGVVRGRGEKVDGRLCK